MARAALCRAASARARRAIAAPTAIGAAEASATAVAPPWKASASTSTGAASAATIRGVPPGMPASEARTALPSPTEWERPNPAVQPSR